MADYLTTNFPLFTDALKKLEPALWAQIVAVTNGETNTYTIFAVNDSGFNASSAGANGLTLDYHVHGPGPIKYLNTPSAGLNFTTLDTQLNGGAALDGNNQVISFQSNSSVDSDVYLNRQAYVVESNLLATNGMIHSISRVLTVPDQNIVNVLPFANVTSGPYETLRSLVNAVGFPADGDYLTLLAPVDTAFDNLFKAQPILKSYFSSNLASVNDSIRAVLSNHVIETAFYPDTLKVGTTTFRTINNASTYVNSENGVVRILTTPTGRTLATVSYPNFIAQNGVAHGIDSVLVPTNFGIALSDLLQLLNATDFLQVLNGSALIHDPYPRTYFVPTNNVSNILNANYTDVLYYVADTPDVNFNNQFVPTLMTLPSLDQDVQRVFTTTVRYGNETVNETMYVNSAQVTAGPYHTSKGSVVYLINSLLPVPVLASQFLANASSSSDYFGLLSERTLNDPGLYNIDSDATTLFVPTNEAFDKLSLGIVGYLRSNNTKSVQVAQQILDNHAVPNRVLYQAPVTSTSYPTANGQSITLLTNPNNQVLLNGDINVHPIPNLTANGVVYSIDDVIVPTGVSFNALDLLEGLPLDSDNEQYGNYSTQLAHYDQTGLSDLLASSDPFTLFAYTDAAWSHSDTQFSTALNTTADIDHLRSILQYGVIYGDNIEELNKSNVYVPGNGTNTTLTVSQAGPDEKTEVTLRTADGKSYTATVVVNTTTSYGQRIYGLDRVLGVDSSEGSSGKGLPTWALILIIVVGIIIGLILLGLIVGAVWYFVVRPNREGYRALN